MKILTRKEIEEVDTCVRWKCGGQEYSRENYPLSPLKHTALALMDYIEADKGIIKQYEGRCEKLEADLALANEEIRHAYNDNETHRRRIGELERQLNFEQDKHQSYLEQATDLSKKVKKLEAVVEAARKFSELFDKMSKLWESNAPGVPSYRVGRSYDDDEKARASFYELREALKGVEGK